MRKTTAILTALALLPFCLLAEELPIGSFENGSANGWKLSIGKEFPGAQGGFGIVKDSEAASGYAAYLEGAFGQGGVYVALDRRIEQEVPFKTLKFKVKTSDFNGLTIRLRNPKGVHQHIEPLKDSSDWQTVVVKDFKGKTYSVYGGAKKGEWINPLTGVSILLEESALKDRLKRGTVLISDIVLEK